MKKKALYLIVLTMVLMLFTASNCVNFTDLASVKAFVLSFGPLAPIAYILMFTLVPLTLFPDAILAIASGTVFGVFWGSVYTIIGAICGSTLSFCIARLIGREFVMKLARHKADWFEEGVEKQGFLIILLLRLVPLIPFDLISYGAGLSKIKYADFLFATFIGIIPGVVIYVNLGDQVFNVNSPGFYLSIGLLIGLFVLSYYLKKRLGKSKFKRQFIKLDED